jgi:hypothetical protein
MLKRGSWSRPICSHISFFIPCFHSSILTFASEYIFQLYCGGLLFLFFKLRNKKGFYTQVFLYGEWCYGQYHSLSVGDILKLIYRRIRHNLLLPILFSMKSLQYLRFLLTITLYFFLPLVYTLPLSCHSCKHGYENRNCYPDLSLY